jgi:DNA-3-methyladenine glycosylase II
VFLPVPEPYDFALSTARFRDYGSDGATVWHEGGLHRVASGREVRIEPTRGGVRVEPGGEEVAREVSHLLGLAFDLSAFRTWAGREPVLARIVGALAGFRPTLHPSAFEALVVAITTQQISLLAAAAIRGRFVERFGVRHERAWAFPTRERVARIDPLELARSDLDLGELAVLPNDEVVATLTELPGIGRWTADWFLARHLARPTAWPAGDLGVRKAVAAFYADGRSLSIEEVRRMGARFDPYQNLSANYLLAGLRMAG